MASVYFETIEQKGVKSVCCEDIVSPQPFQRYVLLVANFTRLLRIH